MENKQEEYTFASLLKLKKNELVDICKSKKLPVSGNKTDLINRILGPDPTTTTTNTNTNPTTTNKPKSSKQTTKQLKTIQEKPIFKKIQEQFTEEKKEPILIKRNQHGNFEHIETKLIFSITKKVIGVQGDDGEIKNLSIRDVENVYKYHFELDPSVIINDTMTSLGITDEKDEDKRIEELLNY